VSESGVCVCFYKGNFVESRLGVENPYAVTCVEPGTK
jgi:hypothetical protein